MISFIIVVISLFLDVVILNNISFLVGELTIFTPLLTFTSIILIYSLYRKNKLLYLSICFFVGVIYDFVCTNLLFFNGLIFLLCGLLVIIFYKNIGFGYIKIILIVGILIILYEVIGAVIINILGYYNISISDLFYKISHSLILNLIYGEVVFIILKFSPNKININ